MPPDVEPGTVAMLPVKVTNLGNGDITVILELVDTSPGYTTVAPSPIVLQCKQTGGVATSTDVLLAIQAPGGGYVGAVGTATYRVRSHDAEDEKSAGDSATRSILLRAKGFTAPISAPALLPNFALGAVAALVSMRRVRAS